jgi:hypothetical protein
MSKTPTLSQFQQVNKTLISAEQAAVRAEQIEKNKLAAKDQLFAISLMLARTKPLPEKSRK